MTDYHVIVYNIERKKDKKWENHSLGPLMEIRVKESAQRTLNKLRAEFPDDEFRINMKTVTYTVTHEVMEELAA